MSAILEPARQFFEACETGQGWQACSAYCHPEATFSSQADALADVSTLANYVYHIVFDGDRIRHMTKIWNDGFSLRQLGWA